MNLSGRFSHIYICESCCGEGRAADMSHQHHGLCIDCAASLQAEIGAEAAEELLDDDAIVAALLGAAE